jgi:2-polyprenyl-6-methoxyphenol hydroxylase-like FAD-dependent oxidoreductase
MKCTIHSEHGSIMVIPRENNMVRLYIQIASSTDKDWNPRKTASEEEVQNSAKRILNPYKIEWERVEWFSVYPIGQGIADKYTLDHRVFIGGDACHTHSVSPSFSSNPPRIFSLTRERSQKLAKA